MVACERLDNSCYGVLFVDHLFRVIVHRVQFSSHSLGKLKDRVGMSWNQFSSHALRRLKEKLDVGPVLEKSIP